MIYRRDSLKFPGNVRIEGDYLIETRKIELANITRPVGTDIQSTFLHSVDGIASSPHSGACFNPSTADVSGMTEDRLRNRLCHGTPAGISRAYEQDSLRGFIQ